MSHEKNSLISLLVLFLLRSCISIDTITPNQPLKDGDILISSGEHFALGFFSPQNSTRRYVGIWYNKVSDQTVVWVANRDNPITNTTGVLSLDKSGNLAVFRGEKLGVPVWSNNVSTTTVGKNYSATLLGSGNFVVFGDSNKEVVAWQSFDLLSDTLLPYMKLGVDRKSGVNRFLTSWKSPEDPGIGAYSYRIDVNGSVPQLFLYKGLDRFWRAGPWNGIRWSGVPEMVSTFIFNVSYVDNPDEVSIMYGIRNSSIISRMVLNESAGAIERVTWNEGLRKWIRFWSAPKDQCDLYAHCGGYGNCNPYNVGEFECKCLPGFEPKSETDWYLRDGSGGCVRKRGGQVCGNGEGFVKMPRVKMPDTGTARVNMSLGIKACEEMCLRNCTCTAYTSADLSRGGNGCISWYGELVDLREFSSGGQDIYIRVDAVELAQYSKKSKRFHGYLKAVIVVLSIAAVLFILSIACCVVKKKKRELFAGTGDQRNLQELLFSSNSHRRTSIDGSSKVEELTERGAGVDVGVDVHLYSLSTIVDATDNFSFANKLGEGGFGSVFKGVLHGGQEIAVKRLSNSSGQGKQEFRNEVMVIAKLQHRNLVRLLGYCIQKEEKMLIYEYLPNKGLDCFIFDEEKKIMLDWRKRFEITLGIARGMVYLHHDSRLKIIHRDLKVSNVLLDASLNPKISDFGMARIFGGDQMEETTKRVVGTYGYMSPEYAMEGLFSIKSDVFSFGVLLLEIISGRKNNSAYYQENSVNLIGHVWDLWNQEKALEIVDSSIGKSNDLDREILRCIHIGLLCVQESASARPTMSEVAYMLSNETTLTPPSQPAFIFRTTKKGPTNSSSTSVGAVSVNDVTISVVEAR